MIGCCVKLKLPTGAWTEVNVSSLSSQLDEADDESFVSRLDINPFTRTNSFSRRSLMARPVRPDESSTFRRVNTLSRAEAKTASVREARAASTSTSICLQCRNELASLIWGKTSPRSPTKKSQSIYDLKSMTITKRRLSRHL